MTDQVPGGALPNGQDGTNQTPPPAPGIPWLPGADELTVGYIQNKGWDGPDKMLDSYRNLEKVFGADKAGHTVVLPKDGAPQAELDAFYNRLGRPASAEGYKLAVPEGADPSFAKTAAQWFHEAGVPAKAAEAIAGKWNEFVKAQNDADITAKNAKFEAEDTALRQKWGAAFQQNVERGAAFVRGAGLDATVIDQLSEEMGHQKTMELFYELGMKMGEAEFVGSEGQSRFGEALTPAQAKAKIEALRQDKEWSAKYMKGDADARAEFERLHRYAYPEDGR